MKTARNAPPGANEMADLLEQAGLEADNPFATPDWRNPTEYPDETLTALSRWRWEFNRRREGLRLGWLMAILACKQGEVDSWTREILPADPRLPHTAFEKHLPIPDHTVFSFAASVEEFEPEFLALGAGGETVACVTSGDLKVRMLRSEDSVLAILDLDKPLTQQFEKIQAIVAKRVLLAKRSGPRNSVSNFPLYLRVLDARDQYRGTPASWMEIARVLFPNYPGKTGEDKARDTYEQASNVCERLFNTPSAA